MIQIVYSLYFNSMSKLSNVYNQAYAFLEDELQEHTSDSKKVLSEELKYYGNIELFELSAVYKRLLESLINRQGFPNFIGKESINKMHDILFEYDCRETYAAYGENLEKLLIKFKKRFPDKRIDLAYPRSAWVQFAKSIISSAKFLSVFDNYSEFDEFVRSFSPNEHTIAALPMLLATEVHGAGFALACDFLKESGYVNYGKPDVHLRDIFIGTGVLKSDCSDLDIFKTIIKIAREVNQEPVTVDKIFWMIGSGKFERGNPLMIGRKKDKFIDSYLKNKSTD